MATQKEGEAIAVLQTRMDNVDRTLLRIEAKIDAQDKKYASKWVQQVVGGFIALVLISVVTALLALVIIPSVRKPQSQAQAATSSTSPTSALSTSPGTSTRDATANANSHSDTATPLDSQSSTSGGRVQVTLPKVQGVN